MRRIVPGGFSRVVHQLHDARVPRWNFGTMRATLSAQPNSPAGSDHPA
ncbi:hypothetical protein BZL30_9415 [Mycobacterium kansasii]|uniref:Uncharacterized protein n=1 Tax=Mycobacterium kansasii TaxID=1768 RepID=A0A1V3W9T4_MYCKA|nr:hypothetical protein BZL30_9415 [Mycobacterium kansasii]